MNTGKERISSFSSQTALLITVLGIAIGTGNIWRFPRIAASAAGDAGAGGFLVAWVVCLFTWSIPLIIAEYGIGRFTGKSVLSAFVSLGGKNQAWKGGFVVLVAVAILAYYGVITGWCVYYLGVSLTGGLPDSVAGSTETWNVFQGGFWPFYMQVAVFLTTGLVVYGGIKWIERVSLVMVPALVLVMLVILIRAVTLEGALRGVLFLFSFDSDSFFNYRTWMEALTQNAWDTGAGWGLILSYAAFAGTKDQIVKNAFRTGIANNLMSLTAAVMVFSTVFALLGADMHQIEILGVLRESGPASTGLTFIWLPMLFSKLPMGTLFAIIFFAGLSMAAFTSFMSMAQLGSRTLVEHGFRPATSLIIVLGGGLFAGSFSAADLNFLGNQDFVWGLALMISGLFIALAISKFGTKKFAEDAINYNSFDWKVGSSWTALIRFGIPVQVLILLGWWTWRTVTEFSPDAWMNPFVPYSVANCLMYWIIGGAFAAFISNRITRSN